MEGIGEGGFGGGGGGGGGTGGGGGGCGGGGDDGVGGGGFGVGGGGGDGDGDDDDGAGGGGFGVWRRWMDSCTDLYLDRGNILPPLPLLPHSLHVHTSPHKQDNGERRRALCAQT